MEELARERLHLLDLGLFAQVDVAAVPDTSAPGYRVRVRVRERPTFLVFPALEYDPEDGVSAGAGASMRNFRGMNQRLGLLALAGAERGASLGFSTPYVGGKRLGLGFRGFAFRRHDGAEDLEKTQWGGAVSVVPARGRTVGFPLEFGAERVRTRPDGGDPADLATPVREDDDHRWFALGAWRDTREYRVRPLRGTRLAASAVFHGGVLGGSVSLERYGLDLLRVVPLGRGHALAGASRILWTRGTVPRYLRVSLGGGGTLRGYDWGEFTGESRWTGWLEERFPLFPTRTFSVLRGRYTIDLTLDGAVFVDGGAVWSGDALERGRARARWGGGAGLRLFAPLVEALNLDLATNGRQVRVYAYGGVRL